MNSQRQALLADLRKFLEALTSYQGNEATNYRNFGSLMIEERINILANAVTILLAEKIEELEKND